MPAENTPREATLQLQITSLDSDHQRGALPQFIKTRGKNSNFLTTAVHKEPLDEDTQPLDNERKITGQYSDADEQNVCSPETGRSDQGVATTNNLLNINAINSSAPKAKRRHQERWRKAGTMMAVCTLLHIVCGCPSGWTSSTSPAVSSCDSPSSSPTPRTPSCTASSTTK
ncbi:hypothetical protein C0Q70_17985 [Pomacea canaliculata]|uniref:Uncharacterized protein n=1 Tax=Pomacea canaliculata TaxID=400727 RepID=A0A2T7NLY3_POMCA|nr:uncharacterized protein LOC112576190 [Pomacea canaliculata]PVD22180.1 hypothetical protein C0Q70_17985 [Pomacea canaliculata]